MPFMMILKSWVHANQVIPPSMKLKISHRDGTTPTVQGTFSITYCSNPLCYELGTCIKASQSTWNSPQLPHPKMYPFSFTV